MKEKDEHEKGQALPSNEVSAQAAFNQLSHDHVVTGNRVPKAAPQHPSDDAEPQDDHGQTSTQKVDLGDKLPKNSAAELFFNATNDELGPI